MSASAILAASWMGPDGHGNDQTGLRPWPEPLGEALRGGQLDSLRWNSLFQTESPRFGRLDWLCRIGLMAVELLEARFDTWDAARLDQVGVTVETSCGSLRADVDFLKNGSPSVFAYTLPSTVIGEVCIRHRFRGPIACFMGNGHGSGSDRRKPPAVTEALDWLDQGDAAACVCLSYEAVDPEVLALSWVAGDFGGGSRTGAGLWHASALLLGKPEDGARRHRPGPVHGMVAALCRRAVGG